MTGTLRAAVDGAAAEIAVRLEELRSRHALGTLPMLPAPLVLPAAQRDQIARACLLVRRALVRVAGTERWAPEIPVPAGLERLVETEDGALERLDSCRLDAVCSDNGGDLQFVEIQAGDPSGSAWVDGISAALAEVGPLRPWARLAPSLIGAHHGHVTSGLPRGGLVAFVNEDTSFVRSDHDLWAHFYRERGTRARRVDPRSFRWDGERLTADGEPVALVVRDSHEELTLSPGPGSTAALWRALEAGLPRFNPFRDVWFDDKACFAILWARREALPADERDVVERHIPPTFMLDGPWAQRARTERERWVVKPAEGYGGFGVVVGADTTVAEWDQALDQALTRRSILQQRVVVGPWDVARLVGDSVEWRRQHVSVSFWCHGGQFTGGFARAGATSVVNVHQGGGIGPLVFA